MANEICANLRNFTKFGHPPKKASFFFECRPASHLCEFLWENVYFLGEDVVQDFKHVCGEKREQNDETKTK